MITIHDGELKRWAVPVRCLNHRWRDESGKKTDRMEVLVFATSKRGAESAAVDKMVDKHLRWRNALTEWVVVGEPRES